MMDADNIFFSTAVMKQAEKRGISLETIAQKAADHYEETESENEAITVKGLTVEYDVTCDMTGEDCEIKIY